MGVNRMFLCSCLRVFVKMTVSQVLGIAVCNLENLVDFSKDLLIDSYCCNSYTFI